MADQEPLDATFFAFNKREQSGVLLRASIAFSLMFLLMIAVFTAAFWNVVAPIVTWYVETMEAMAAGNESLVATPPVANLLWFFPIELLFLFCFFVIYAAYEAACLRWLIRGESGGGILGLRFDADTWRVYGTYWMWFVLLIGAYIAIIVCVIAIGAVIAMLGDSGGAIGVLLGVFGAIALICAAIYFAVRLAPAAATSIGTGRFAFFKAWSVTRGRFWSLFGAFLLLWIIYMVASWILSTILFTVVLGTAMSGIDMTTAATDPEAFSMAYINGLIEAFSSPTSIAIMAVYYLVASAIGLIFYVAIFGVNARAVQAALREGKIGAAPV